MSESTYSEEIADLLRQAEETLRGGDPDSARMIFEAVLQIDPENDAALAGVERASFPPSGPPSGDFDLQLDFDLAAAAAPAPGRHAAPAGASAPKPEALEDLLEAADQLPAEEPRQATSPSAAARAAEGEAALLAEQARRHLFQGDLAKATELASRALAMHESCDAAQEILEEARTETARRAATAEHLLSDAIAAIERGGAAQAIPMLQQVLGLAPAHPEALEWLARARQSVQAGRVHDPATSATGPAPVVSARSPEPTPASAVTAPRPVAALRRPPPPAEPGPSDDFKFQSNATPEPTTVTSYSSSLSP